MAPGWVIYNSKGIPLVSSKSHDHTAADGSGPATNDEHDGYSEYDEIAAPAAPAANKLRLYQKDVGATTLPFFKNSGGVENALLALPSPLTTTFWEYTDLLTPAAALNDKMLWQAVTGAGAAWTDQPSEASHRGVWQGVTGTTATGHARLYMQNDSVMFSNGMVRCGAWVRTISPLSSAAQRYEIYVGIINGNNTSGSTEGVYLRYRDDLNGGNWQCGVINGGVHSNADSGVAVAAAAWYYLEIEVNAAGNSVEFFIDGSSVGTIASGPAASATAEMRIGILKSVGVTIRGIKVDAAYLMGELTAGR